MRTLTIAAPDLRALRPFCSRDVSRGAITGILIERSGVAVATDGHTLMAAAPMTEPNPHSDYTRPHRDVVLQFEKPIPTWAEWVTLDIDDDAPKDTRAYVVRFFSARKDAIGSCVELAGPFPNWRQVIPRDDELCGTAPTPLLNGTYVERFSVGSGRVHLVAQSNPSRAVAVFPEEPRYFGLIMPVVDQERVLGKSRPVPEFVRTYPTPAQGVAA